MEAAEVWSLLWKYKNKYNEMLYAEAKSGVHSKSTKIENEIILLLS